MNPLDRLLRRRRAYRQLFLEDDGSLKLEAEVVMKDLARFCRLARPTTVVSPISRQTDVPATFQAEGRREVMLRLLAMIRPDDATTRKLMVEESEND